MLPYSYSGQGGFTAQECDATGDAAKTHAEFIKNFLAFKQITVTLQRKQAE